MRGEHDAIDHAPLQSGTAPLCVQRGRAIGVVVPLPFLGVSSLNFGPLFGAAFFLYCTRASSGRLEPRSRLELRSFGCDTARCQIVLDLLHDVVEDGRQAVP
jgi:hypothetical protein